MKCAPIITNKATEASSKVQEQKKEANHQAKGGEK